MESSFLDRILSKDREVLIYLNNLGSEHWDAFWLFITNQFNWVPLFVFLIFLIFFKFGVKRGIFTLLFLVILVAFTDQFTNLIKNLTGRTRPCNVVELQEYLRQFSYKSGGKSFWSGHACLSTTFTTFMILLFRSKTKYIYFLVIFPLLFGYSRIYLRVHYPLDVLSGYTAGFLLGAIFYYLYSLLENRFKFSKT